MVNHLLNRTVLITTATMLAACVGLSSCETLRKKFTRKKKETQVQSGEFQPILQPEEYPAPENNIELKYTQHYGLIKVWYKDLWTGINEKNSDGKVKYAIKQVLEHIEEMKPLLKTEKAAELTQLTDLLKSYQEALGQERQARNYSRIQSDLRAFHRILRSQFFVNVVKKDFINQ